MIIHHFLLVNNPFIQAYSQSDLLGKLIFLGLLILSIISWFLIFYKWKITRDYEVNNLFFSRLFQKHKNNPLEIPTQGDFLKNSFASLYFVLKRQTIELLAKNSQLLKERSVGMLSTADIEFVGALLNQQRKIEAEKLERNMYILSMFVTLAPFLGLLGTVWGILMTFSHMQRGYSGSNQLILGGISLALATTVLGLIDAIPALIGYHFLKQRVKKIDFDMENFSTEILSAIELNYRKVDL